MPITYCEDLTHRYWYAFDPHPGSGIAVYYPLIMWHLLADIHFDIKNLARLQSFFNFYLVRFEQTRPNHVIFLGDTFNVRTGTDAHLHRVFSDYLRRILDAPQSPQVHLLVGNHDMKNRFDRSDNALYPFSLIRNQVHVYHEITRTNLDGHKAIFIPYHHDETHVARFIRAEPSDRVDSTVAFFHGTFRGAIQNGASDSGHSVCHDSVIDNTNLGRYRRAFLGHFHTHGCPSACSNVTYVGSPVQSNMGDAGDLKRGYIEYDPKGDTWSLVANPEAEYYLNMSWAESIAEPNRVRDKKVRLVLETAEETEGVRTANDIQRHIDYLYSHGAHHIESRRVAPLKSILEPAAEAGEAIMDLNGHLKEQLKDDALPITESISSLIQSFLRTDQSEIDFANGSEASNLTLAREEYLLSIINDHFQQHGVVTPVTTFQADLLRIEMCNFRGVSGKSIFNLDALSQGTVFLVTSSNGNGKSTLLEAIFWCLYGKFLDPDVSAEEAIHTGKRSCSVTLHFRNDYTFTRSRSGRSPKFEIYLRGKLVEQGHDAGTTTQYLESQLLHMNSETFRRTIVITDHATSSFLATRDLQRTKSLDIMFGLDVLREIRGRLEENFKVNKNRCIELQFDCDKASEALTTLALLHQKCSTELKDSQVATHCKRTAILVLSQSEENMHNMMQQKEASVQQRRCMMKTLEEGIARLQHQVKLFQRLGILEGKLLGLRHEFKLYQTIKRASTIQVESERHQLKLHQAMEKVRSAQAKVEKHRLALAREENKQEHTWGQVSSFVNRLSRRYLIPLIGTVMQVGTQISWFKRLFAPALQKSLVRLKIATSPPVMIHSQDGLKKLLEELRISEGLLQVLTKNPTPELASLSSRPENGYEDSPYSGLTADHAHPFKDEPRLPKISQLTYESENIVLFAQAKRIEIQSLLEGDEKEYLMLSQQIHEVSCDIARQDGHLEEMVRQEKSCSQKADELMQQHYDSLQHQKRSMDERTKAETTLAISTFWLEQLQDTATQKGPFMTYCRTSHVNSLNTVIAQVLDELSQDSEGMATQCLDFQLKPDYTLEPLGSGLSVGKRSKGQKTRTYLALFLAMFQQARSRLPFRTSFVFLDEIMDNLDLHGIEALQRWLQRYVAERRMQAFLMTHRETTLVGNVIEVIRDRERGTEYKLRQEGRGVIAV